MGGGCGPCRTQCTALGMADPHAPEAQAGPVIWGSAQRKRSSSPPLLLPLGQEGDPAPSSHCPMAQGKLWVRTCLAGPLLAALIPTPAQAYTVAVQGAFPLPPPRLHLFNQCAGWPKSPGLRDAAAALIPSLALLIYHHYWCPSAGRFSLSASRVSTRLLASSSLRRPFCRWPAGEERWRLSPAVVQEGGLQQSQAGLSHCRGSILLRATSPAPEQEGGTCPASAGPPCQGHVLVQP